MDHRGPRGQVTTHGGVTCRLPSLANRSSTPTILASAATIASSPATERPATITERFNSTATNAALRQGLVLPLASNPSVTISSLSSSLIAAQTSISALATQLQQAQLASSSAVASAQSVAVVQVQQVQLASVSAVELAQSAAATSASSAVSSFSSNAALALAAASSIVSSANSVALAASQAADQAVANASSIQAQADLRQRLDNTRFTDAQLIIAIVVSIVGTLLLGVASYLVFVYVGKRRERRELEKKKHLKEMILRPNTGNSSGSGDNAWEDAVYTTRPPGRPPRNPLRPSPTRAAPPRGPPKAPLPRPPDTILEETRPANWPMEDDSLRETTPTPTASSPGPNFSLFPRPMSLETARRRPPQSPLRH